MMLLSIANKLQCYVERLFLIRRLLSKCLNFYSQSHGFIL